MNELNITVEGLPVESSRAIWADEVLYDPTGGNGNGEDQDDPPTPPSKEEK